MNASFGYSIENHAWYNVFDWNRVYNST